MKSGIYCIINLKNGKRYIGQSINFTRRWNEHRKGVFKNKINSHLVNAWNKYGESNFTFQILEYCEPLKLSESEQFWIEYFESWKKGKGYNKIRYIGEKYFFTEDVKQKMSCDRKGLRTGDKSYWFGRTLTKEHKNKISEGNKGKKFSAETIEKMKQASFWKKNTLSYDHKQKISDHHADVSGNKNPNAKLDWDKVKEIRRKFEEGCAVFSLAQYYGVQKSAIFKIVNFKTWKEG